jgi:hypothetical protein
MQEYIIYVNDIEALQMTRDMDELERIFLRAKSTIVQGEAVVLMRKNQSGPAHKVDELTTEPDLKRYKDTVLKYL